MSKFLAKALGTLLAVVFAVSGTGANPAWAQADPQGAAAAAAPQVSGLESVMVTARKREESVQEIPVSVSVISTKELERRSLTNLEEIAASTPQFSVGRSYSGSGARLTLRGIGSSASSIGIEQSVATIVDGVYYGQGRIINEGFFDLERVEILKGPQALFFGKNATAGAISITTADPTNEFYFRARAGYEIESETIDTELVGSGPITDKFGVRVALRFSNMFGGYFRNIASPINYVTTDRATGAVTAHVANPTPFKEPGEDEIVGRVTFKWAPTDALTSTLKASFSDSDTNNASWNLVTYRCPTGRSVANPARICSTKDFVLHQSNIPEDIGAVTRFTDKDGLHNHYRSWAITNATNYELDDVTLTSITNYNTNRTVWASSSGQERGIWATEDSEWRAFSTEARALTTFDGPINVLLGAYYQRTKRIFDQDVVFSGLEDSSVQPGYLRYVAYNKNSETQGETLSGFGQVVWAFMDRFELTAGARYTHETKDSYFVQPYVHPTVRALFVQGVTSSVDQTFNNWSPEATLSWRPTDDINVYAAYKTGYKSGGFSNSGIYSGLSTAPDEDFAFDAEKAKGFEIGVKSTLFGNQLRLNVGLFRYGYSNLQVDFFNSPTFANQTINAGSAVTKGIESEFEYAPAGVEGLRLRGSINYTRARYVDFFAPCYSGQTPAQGCTTLVGPGGGPYQQLAGQPTAVAPEWTGTLGVLYEGSINDKLTFGISVDARYSDDYLASGFGQPLSHVNDYVALDASLRIGTVNERWEFAVIGKNLTNRLYILGAGDAPSTGSNTGRPNGVPGDQLGQAALPRTIQLQLTYTY